MKIQTKRTLCAGLVAAITAVTVLIACSAPTKVGIKAELAGVKIEVTVDSGGHPTTSSSGSLPPGKCLKITYSGADGAVTGTATIGVPGSSQIPPGSVRQDFDIVDCPPPAAPLAVTPGSGYALATRVTPNQEWRDVFGYPILPDTSTGGMYLNAAYHFRVKCAATQDPMQFVKPILLVGPGAAVPDNVDVVFFAQMIPEPAGARFRAADTDTFAEFRLDWNGVLGYADLVSGTNISQFSMPNHWDVVETFIPLSDVNGNINGWNGGVAISRTRQETQLGVRKLKYQTLAF